MSRRLLARIELGRRTVLGHGVDRERSLLVSGHARRSRRHAGKRDACDRGPLGQELPHDIDRHVAIDDVAVHEHRVAALKFFGNAGLAADLGEIIGGPHVDLEAVLAQIGGITFAARALWVLVQGCMDRLGDGRQRQRDHGGDRALAESPSLHHSSPSAIVAGFQATRSTVIIPDTWWSVTWQCSIQSPGLSATKATSTVSFGGTRTVSAHCRYGTDAPFRVSTRKLMPCRCIGCHQAVSLRIVSTTLRPRWSVSSGGMPA